MDEAETYWLTLAEGADRWEVSTNGSRRYRTQGALWFMLWADGANHRFVVLRPDVAHWCWENIGPYRIVDHLPNTREDAWRIEFKTATDMVLFKLNWMGQ